MNRPLVEALAGLNESVQELRRDIAATRKELGHVELSQRPTVGTIFGFLGSAIAVGAAWMLVLHTRDDLTDLKKEQAVEQKDNQLLRDAVVRLQALQAHQVAPELGKL